MKEEFTIRKITLMAHCIRFFLTDIKKNMLLFKNYNEKYIEKYNKLLIKLNTIILHKKIL